VHIENLKFASTIHTSSSVCGPTQDVVLIMEVKEKVQLLVMHEKYHMYEEN
jgi:hypothetical protein